MYPSLDDLQECAGIVDAFTYGDDAAWDAIQKRGTGNCKNFAAGKKVWLYEHGWPVGSLRLGIVRVEPGARYNDDRGIEVCHAILFVFLPDGRLRALDQRFPNRVLTLHELRHMGYEGIEVQDPNSPTGWSNFHFN